LDQVAGMTSERLGHGDRPVPEYDIDYEYGRQGELQIMELLDWIANGDGRVEVKTKRALDLVFYVETSCDKQRRGCYQPSGISTTKAHAWVFNIADTGLSVVIPTDLIRRMLDDPTTKDKNCPRGDYPTRGKLINLGATLFRLKQQRERGRTS